MSAFFFHDFPLSHHLQYNLDQEVYYLHGTDEGEPSEEPHGSTNISQLVEQLGCSVLKLSMKTTP